MKKGTRVTFHWPALGGERVGRGEVITDEVDGHVLISCDPEDGEARHFVIRCTVTWLTPITGSGG